MTAVFAGQQRCSAWTSSLCLAITCLLTTPVFADEPAYQTPQRPKLPKVQNAQWCQTPVDRFILAGLEEQQLSPSTKADRRTLIRRITVDLTGLPPTPRDVRNFLGDASPLAYERVVDRLLASPAYGVRWGQHWLDVVRYADSDGFEYDDPRPHAWRYRDWVIRAFNEDKPFDRFVAEQIAADELFPQDRRALAALGLHRLGPLRLNAGMQDVAKNRQEVLTEITDAVGSAFLGLTLGCARCHDHKFDPLSQADYFRIQSFFAATTALDIPMVSSAKRQAMAAARKKWIGANKQLRGKIDALVEPAKAELLKRKRALLPAEVRRAAALSPAHRTKQQTALLKRFAQSFMVTRSEVLNRLTASKRAGVYRRLHARLAELQDTEPPVAPAIMGVADQHKSVPATYVLFQGNPHKRRGLVRPKFPASFQRTMQLSVSPKAVPHIKHRSSGRRATLARWLGSSRHPLTYRVFVNRLWQHHFGRGIVATPNDFGEMGEPATHPELLDWLATELARNGGQIKPLHRLMVLSATYRQQSRPAGKSKELKEDPDNELFWRMNRRRLESEVLRDGILAVAGTLNRQAGGPGVRLPLSKEIADLQYKGVWQPNPRVDQHMRRTVFVFLKRNNRPPLLESFDSPSTMQSCGRRSVSLHAGQALTLLNGEISDRQAAEFAKRLIRECGSAPEKLMRRAYDLALARQPRPQELRLAVSFLRKQTKLIDNKSIALREALSDFCLVLFNLDEFLYVD